MIGLSKSVALAAGIISLLACAPALAVEVENLYLAKAIVTGIGEKNRIPGLVQCLQDVLVRVSGDPRLIGDPAATALAKNVTEYVASFRYRDRLEGIPIHDEQGSYDRPHDLTVDFAPEKIDAALASLGRKPWTTERPLLVMFLGVENTKGSFVLAGDGDQSPYMAESVALASERVGMPVTLPSEATLSEAGLTFDKLASADPEGLEPVARAAGGDLVLAGSLIWSDAEHGWIADWRFRHGGGDFAWHIRGVGFDDAFRNGLRGAAQILSGNGVPRPNAP
jgi:hypothetical protein